MADRDQNRRENDARQSSEADKALGQDERMFGAGGQKTQGPPGDDKLNPEAGRDATVPSEPPEKASVGSLAKEKQDAQ